MPMSAKRRRTTFGMHHLTVVPTNAEARGEDEDDEQRPVPT